jgi:cardiolipin synthase
VDRDLAAIGSANLDLRSFCLNFELGLVIYSSDFTSQLHFLQTSYLERSERLTEEAWSKRSTARIVGDNLAKLMTPLL